MFMQDLPPDTSAYMIAGYSVFAVVMSIYLLSLFLRWRNLRRDLAVLEELAAKKASPPPAASRKAARRG